MNEASSSPSSGEVQGQSVRDEQYSLTEVPSSGNNRNNEPIAPKLASKETTSVSRLRIAVLCVLGLACLGVCFVVFVLARTTEE